MPFDQLFDIDEIQKLQDQFADVFGVASIITSPEGDPITRPSRFIKLCDQVIRENERGRQNCKYSDKIIGRPSLDGPIVRPCLSCGLWDAGVSIIVGNRHVANWLIGQVRDESFSQAKLAAYLRDIGAPSEQVSDLYEEIPVMSKEKFQSLADLLFILANQLAETAFQKNQTEKLLNEQTREHRLVLRDIQRFESLERINNYKTDSVQDFLDFVLAEAIKLTSSKIGYIYLYDEEKKEFSLNTWSKEVMPQCKVIDPQTKYSLDKTGAWGEAVRQRKPIVINDFKHNNPFSKGMLQGHVEIHNFLTVPVFDHDQIVAVVGMANKPENYDDTDVQQLDLMVSAAWNKLKGMELEKKIRESEENYRVTLACIGDGVITTDTKGNVVYLNTVAEQLTGWTEVDAKGKPLEEVFRIINEYTRAEVEIPVRQVIREGVTVGLANHTILIAKDNTERPIADSGAPIKNDRGEIIGVVLVFRDQTHERKLENELKESEIFFRKTQFAGKIGSYKLDNLSDTWSSSEVLDDILGIDDNYPRTAGTWKDLVYVEDLRQMYEHFYNRTDWKNQLFSYEFRIVRPSDGALRWLLGKGSFNFDSDGSISSMYGTIQDITELKDAEFERLKLLSIIDNSLNEIYLINAVSLKFEYANRGALKNIGYSLEEICCLTPFDLKPDYMDDAFRQPMNQLLSEEKDKIYFEALFKRNNGIVYPVEVFLQLFDDGNSFTFCAFVNDITYRKSIEGQIRESEDQFRRAIALAPFPAMLHADDEQILVLSKSWTELSGYSVNDFQSTSEWNKKALGKQQIRMKEYFDRVFKMNHWVDEGSFQVTTKNQEKRNWEFGSAPLGYTSDRRRLMISMARDVTERDELERKLSDEKKLLRTLIDNLPFSVFIKDAQAWKIIANRTDIEWLGATSENELIGKTDIEIIGGSISQKLLSDDMYVIKNRIPIENLEECITDKKGNVVYIKTSKFPLIDDLGEVYGLVGFAQDITDIKKSQEEILKLQQGVEQSSSTVVITDIHGNIEYVNPYFTEVTGYTREEAIGKNPRILKSENVQDTFYKKMWETLLKGDVWRGEFQNMKKNGELFWESATISSVKNAKGEIINFIAIKEDITASKRIQSELVAIKDQIEESEKKYRFIAENTSDGILLIDAGAKVQYVSPSYLKYYGFSEEEMLTHDAQVIYSLVHPDDRDELFALIYKSIETKQPELLYTYRFKNKDGNYIWREDHAKFNYDEDYNYVNSCVLCRNITERKKAEEEIRKLYKAVESSRASIVITDLDGAIEYANPYFSELTGYLPEEYLGKNPRLLKTAYHDASFYTDVWNKLKTGKTWEGEFCNRKKNGDLYWEYAIISPITNSNNEIAHFVAIKSDITESKGIERELLNAKEKAEESDRLKSAFLANMSHEIRTPLNSILGFSELLKDPELDEFVKSEFIDLIIKGGNNLLNIISDIVDISKIEAGVISLSNSKILLMSYLDEIEGYFNLQVKEKGLDFYIRVTDSLIDKELSILGDKQRLMQVFNNLIGNAVKFTSKGFIGVEVFLKNQFVEFQVKDSGIGIPQELQDKVFERFVQVESAFSRTYGGNGLGLAITKNLIELMGGNIWLESELGKGSTFFFTIPVSND